MAYAVGVRGQLNVPREFMNRSEGRMAQQLRPDLFKPADFHGSGWEQLPKWGKITTAVGIGVTVFLAGMTAGLVLAGWTYDRIQREKI